MQADVIPLEPVKPEPADKQIAVTLRVSCILDRLVLAASPRHVEVDSAYDAIWVKKALDSVKHAVR
jgi:hypothetical protein